MVEAAVADAQPDPNLLLVHLHRIDYDLCLARHRATAARNWSEYDVQARYGWQNRVVEAEAFHTWFFRGFDDGQRELIPEKLKKLL